MNNGTVLFTADWQMRAANLPQIEDLVARLHSIAAEENVSTVVHCGDVKEHLNPVDLRVTNAALRAIVSFKLKGITTYVLKGNHDAGGYADNAESWLPSMQAAGALTIDQPTTVDVEGVPFHFVPFMRDTAAVEKAIDTVARGRALPKVLVLHASIQGAYDNGTHLATDAVSRECVEKFPLVISGHIHMPQVDKAKRIWYVGSPFAMDWGEVNQRKRVLIYDPRTQRVKSIWLDFPGLFDPSLPDFPAKIPPGSTVRIRHTVAVGETETSAAVPVREKAAQRYPGCTIVTEAIETTAEAVEAIEDTTDEETITAYVQQAVPDNLRNDAAAISHYINTKLVEAEGVARQTVWVDLLGFEAKNVLSFEHVTYKFRKGVTVLSGHNADWGDRSNGAGKTNLLQLPLIALSGKTTKGQSADGWRRAGSRGECWVKLSLMVGKKKVEIVRGRQPKGTRVYVDGEDVTRGKEHEIQKQIEELTGLTWDVAVTALWIDQRKANKLLHGQDTERKALLSQFLNLERFNRAQTLVKEKRDQRAAALQSAQAERIAAAGSIDTLQAALQSAQADADTEAPRALLADAKAALQEHEETVRKDLNALAKQRTAIEDEIAQAEQRRGVAQGKLGGAQHAIADIDATLHKAIKLDVAVCPTCGAELDRRATQKRIEELRKNRETVEADAAAVRKRIASYKQTIEEASDTLYKMAVKERKLEDGVKTLRNQLSTLQASVDAADKINKAMQGTRDELAKAKERAAALSDVIEHHMLNLEIDKFAVSALGKNGIPAFLMARTCPRLNKAAKRYSKLVSDGVIQVQFSLDEKQDITATVINTQGGTEVEDQSVGETTSAVLVVALALRDIMLPCNVLIADEPGDGLDEVGARALAKVVRGLSNVYESVLVTTHNPYIMAELSECRTVQVTKHNKVSKLV